MWKLAFRNIFRQRSRTALTLAAITFGVASLILSGGFVQDFFIQLREATIYSQFGHLQVFKKGYFELGRKAPYQYMIEEAEKKAAELRQLEHVDDVTTRINFSGLLSNGRTTFPVIGEGVDPQKELRLARYINLVAGTHLPNNELHAMMIGQGVANALNLEVGDSAFLLVNTRDGAINTFDFKISGIFQTFSKEFDDRALRISIIAAQELLATKAAHSLVFALTETSHTDAVAQDAIRILPRDEFETKTWYQLADFYQKAVDLYDRYFLVLHIIILGLVLLSVANSVNMTIFERTGEFGTLMALGNRGSAVFKLILQEIFLLALIGSIAGVILGIALAAIISAIGIPMPPMPNTNSGYTALIRIVPSEIAKAFAVGFAATVFAAVYPARRASKLKVVDALRYN
jgi:putative ABC transport system permease protein